MEVIKANLNNQKHRAMYENFCKKNQLEIEIPTLVEKEMPQKMNFFLLKNNRILENCKIEIEKDLKKASLQLEPKKEKGSKVKEIYLLIKNCVEYLFMAESIIDIILHVENSKVGTLLDELGYDILPLGEDEKGQYLYSIFKETIEEE